MITGASYRDRKRFARSICELACLFLSATPLAGPQPAGASESTSRMPLDKKTLHCVVITIPLLPRPHPNCGRVPQVRSARALAARGNARSAAVAPKNLKQPTATRDLNATINQQNRALH